MIRNRSLLSAAIGVSLAWLLLPACAGAAEYRAVKEPVDGQYIVVLKDTAASLASEPKRYAPVQTVAKGMADFYHVTVLKSYDHVLRGFAVRATDDAILRMQHDPRIDYIEENAVAHANTTQANADWGLARISERTNTLNALYTGTYTYTTTASNVHAYVIDSGLNATNTDFSGRIGAGVAEVADGNGTSDCDGHGTHVSGILGGTVYGVAKGVTIHPVRVLGCTGTGTTAEVLAGIDWVAKNHVSPAVANMSVGFGGLVSTVDAAVASLTASGVTIAVAAGNDEVDACTETPSDAPSAITVGSTRADDGISWFTNFGTCVTMFAPGTHITSDWIGSTTATTILDGTSMASPHVAGAAALYLATHPTATPSQVKAALVASATPRIVIFPRTDTTSPRGMAYTLGGTVVAPAKGNPPSGSPNCDGSMGGSIYWCSAKYTSSSPVAFFWQDPQLSLVTDDSKLTTSFKGHCTANLEGVNWTVDFTVGNRDGYDVDDQTFYCEGGDTK